MKKVLILANSSNGLYGFRNELLLELLKKYEVYVSLPEEVNRKELEEEGCRFILTPMNRRGMNPFEDLKLCRRYLKILKEVKPDLVLTYTIKPNIYGGICCRQKNIPYMATITGLGTAFQKKGLLRSLIVCLYRKGLKKAARVFFQNKENRKTMSDCRIVQEKQCVPVNGSGVNTEIHSYREYPDNEETHFLFVGRVMREKGINEFLDAAGKLKNEKVFFDIVGDCDEDYEEQLRKLEQRGIITWYDFQMNVDPFYERCSALVLPTYHEGMSNVLMEASASGRPVLASNISGCREIFEEGVTGFGFSPRDSESLIRALKKFLTLPIEERRAMGYNARVKMEKEFNRQGVVQTYLEQIEKIINE